MLGKSSKVLYDMFLWSLKAICLKNFCKRFNVRQCCYQSVAKGSLSKIVKKKKKDTRVKIDKFNDIYK